MRLRVISLGAFVVAVLPTPAQDSNPPAWAKTYGFTTTEAASGIDQTIDGGFAVSATITTPTGTMTPPILEGWVLKLTPDGAPAWQKKFGAGNATVRLESVAHTSDGGAIAAGRIIVQGTKSDALVIKLDANGGVQWKKAYGTSDSDTAQAIHQTSDGGYILVGNIVSGGATPQSRVWVLKLNADASISWQHVYGGQASVNATSIEPTGDGGFVISGGIVQNNQLDAWILKIGFWGSIDWQKSYGGANLDVATSVQPTSDNGYIVACNTMSFGAGGMDAWVLKLDSGGAITWQNSFGGSADDSVCSVRQTADGGYVVAGTTASFGSANTVPNLWAFKLDPSVDSSGKTKIQWQKYYGGGNSAGFGLSVTAEGSLALAGYNGQYGAGDSDVWVLKAKSDGTIPAATPLDHDSNVTVTVTVAAAQVTFATDTLGNATAHDPTLTVTATEATVKTQAP